MGFMTILKRALSAPSHGERELDYLNASTSRVDLEMRQREIDRGHFRRR